MSQMSSTGSHHEPYSAVPGVEDRLHIVLLVGGPYDGQDIVVTREEWISGTLIRHNFIYSISGGSEGERRSSSSLRKYYFSSLGSK